MKQSIIAQRSFEFSVAVIQATKLLPKNCENLVIIKQMIRSVTSIGANIEEGLEANSRKDFIHSMNIAKKEARETRYWFNLLQRLHTENKQVIHKTTILLQENEEIINMLTSIVKTSTNNL